MTQQANAFRKPWTNGAKAYHEADTLAALEVGARRMRKSFTVYVGDIGNLPCAHCGRALNAPYEVNDGAADFTTDDRYRGEYNPRSGVFTPHHYYCGWKSLMRDVITLGRLIQLRKGA